MGRIELRGEDRVAWGGEDDVATQCTSFCTNKTCFHFQSLIAVATDAKQSIPTALAYLPFTLRCIVCVCVCVCVCV